MDTVFLIANEADRSSYLRSLMNSFDYTYICLWLYLPQPNQYVSIVFQYSFFVFLLHYSHFVFLLRKMWLVWTRTIDLWWAKGQEFNILEHNDWWVYKEWWDRKCNWVVRWNAWQRCCYLHYLPLDVAFPANNEIGKKISHEY